MSKYDDIKSEIKELIDQGIKLINGLEAYSDYYKSDKSLTDDKQKSAIFFINNYEIWFSKALLVVKQFLPDRYNDFYSLYKNDKRKDITWQNYTISDAVQGKATSTHSFYPGMALRKLNQQVDIIETCLEYFDKKVFDIQSILQADVFDSEIDSAKHLLKMGFLRAAGAICGVVLEKHFKSVCENRQISLRKKSPTIADYNDSLKDVAYDTIEWRRIQRLGDLRNLCDHSKDREPTKDDVEELISGTERVIKTIF